ncbi:VRR-Nuc domain protein [Arthrobacter phage Mudcat]|uniref:VRR-Nuc domain protein n=1 Tax=Arthrobacter phage Mudcat TaxID=1796997 RepID=A0A140G723_9CAUD|nr:endonuclease [Arthrobacter phage Mudcat]AMM44458.1 VRR-Nuc domain protein [Arthrobacter phage Mudcat]
MAKRESAFEQDLCKELEHLFPGAVILKNDSSHLQGIPDRLILWQDRWAALEAKRSGNEPHQPNQDWWVQTLDSMSFASFIYPENKEAILSELQYSFGTRR